MYAVIKSQGEINFVIVHQMSLLTTVKLGYNKFLKIAVSVNSI